MSIERYGADAKGAGGQRLPFSKAVRAGDFVFVSGQVAVGPDGEIVGGGIVEQTRRTIENVRAILESVDLGLSDVVKVTVWLEDTRDFWSFNRVYTEYFGAALPARSCVRAELMSPGKVEIEAIAYAPR
ncbi:MAG: Rid family detoxifying hydrolase [Steroidobacteraceae bacterium]